MSVKAAMEAQGWERASFLDICRRVALRTGKNSLRWQEERVAGRTLLFLVGPDGERWHFKLQRGAWIKKADLL